MNAKTLVVMAILWGCWNCNTAQSQLPGGDPFLVEVASRDITTHELDAPRTAEDEWTVIAAASYKAKVPLSEPHSWTQSYTLSLYDENAVALGMNSGSWTVNRGVTVTWDSTITVSQTGIVPGFRFISYAKLKLEEDEGLGLLGWTQNDAPWGWSALTADAAE